MGNGALGREAGKLGRSIWGSRKVAKVGDQSSHKNSNSHIDASHSRQPLVKGERLVRYEVNAVMTLFGLAWARCVDCGMW